MGLAGAGRAVEEEAAAQVLAGRAQLFAAPGHAHHLALHPLQQARREHDVVAGDAGAAVEAERAEAVPELRALEGEDLAAEDVVLAHERVDPGEQPVRELLLLGEDLDLDLVAPVCVGRAAQQHHEPLVAVRAQVEPAGDAGQFLVGGDRQMGVVDRADHEAVVAVGGFEDVAEGEVAVVLGAAHADQLVGAALGGEPALQGEVDVGQVVGRVRGFHHRAVRGGRAEVFPQPPGEVAAAVPLRLPGPGDRHEELLEQAVDLLDRQRRRIPVRPVPALVLGRAHDLQPARFPVVRLAHVRLSHVRLRHAVLPHAVLPHAASLRSTGHVEAPSLGPNAGAGQREWSLARARPRR